MMKDILQDLFWLAVVVAICGLMGWQYYMHLPG